MSTTTVSYRSTSHNAALDELRRREADARRAARQAAQRAEAQRRREEAERRRIQATNQAIAEQEAAFQREVERLDKAARRLPDLTLTAPRLPTVSEDIARNADKLEAYAARLRGEIQQFSRRLNLAIAEGERLLQRRLRLAAAWREAGDLERQVEALAQICRDAAAGLHETLRIAEPPARPSADAELETVEPYVSALMTQAATLRHQQASLSARVAAGERAAGLSGPQVQARGATDAHDRHAAERLASARARLRAHLNTALAVAGLALGDLPAGLCLLIDDAVAQAHRQDQAERITRWIAREKQSREGIRRALELMGMAPDLVQEDQQLTARWTGLLAQLQRIASGLEAYTPGIEHEYQQLQTDARRLVNTAFTRADWVKAMSEQGFEILEREDGQGLVVVDLDQPDIWLEATPLEAEEGGFAAMLELKTNTAAAMDEARVTDAVCAKLAQAAGVGTAEVQVEAEVIERKPRITRARRPARTMAQRL